jgi:hypothetical protein
MALDAASTDDGWIVDVSGKVIYFSAQRFIADIALQYHDELIRQDRLVARAGPKISFRCSMICTDPGFLCHSIRERVPFDSDLCPSNLCGLVACLAACLARKAFAGVPL